MDVKNIRIEKLTADNWCTWKFDLDITAHMLNLYGLLDGTTLAPEENATAEEKKRYEESDNLLRYIIGTSVSHDVKQHLLTCRSAKQMWDVLVSIYQQKNERRLDILYCQLFQYKKDPEDSIAVHASKLQKIFNDLNEELKEENIALPDSLLLNRVLNTLPDDYLEFKNSWESVSKEARKLTYLIERLRLHEQRLQERDAGPSENSSFLAKSKQRKFSQPRGRQDRNSGSGRQEARYCSYCKRTNHDTDKCWFKKNDQQKPDKSQKGDQSRKSNLTLCAFEAGTTANDNSFYIDSGAAFHLCSDKELLKNVNPDATKIRIANKQIMTVKCIGDIVINVDSDSVADAVIKDVRFVPGLAANLLSVSKCVDNGLTVVFSQKGCEIFKEDCCSIKGKPVMTASRDKNLYKLDVAMPAGKSKSKNSSFLVNAPKSARNTDSRGQSNISIADKKVKSYPKESQIKWHRRVAHLNHRAMETMKRVVEGMNFDSNKSNELCEPCVMGKMARKSFPKSKLGFERSKELLGMIHSDVGVFPEKSLGGAKYYVTFIDDFSRKAFVYVLKSKDQVFDTFVSFKNYVENQKGTKIKTLHTDNGGEYVNHRFKKFLDENGIQHLRTMPYTPQQNSIAERYNRTICEKVRSMLNYAGLGPEYWAEAILTATYIRNRCPTNSRDGKIPEEIWSDRRIKVDHFRIFGCTAYVHVNLRKKNEPKAKKYLFLGYKPNGYRLGDLENRHNCINARNVVFNENEFPVSSADENYEEECVIPLARSGGASTSRNDNNQPPSPQPGYSQWRNGAATEENNDEDESDAEEESDDDDEDDLESNHGHKNTQMRVNTQKGMSKVVSQPETPEDVREISNNFSRSVEITPSSSTTMQGSDYTITSDMLSHSDDTFYSDMNDTLLSQSDDSFYNVEEVGVVEQKSPLPKTVAEALAGNESEQWREAIKEEWCSLHKNRTWDAVPAPAGEKIIGSKWVFAKKHDEKGVRYKARLVAKGYAEIEGVHYNHTYAPVVRYSTLRMLLALVMEHDFKLNHFDVKTAFLLGDLEETIYMQPAECNMDGKVARLNKAIYGLKQSARCWYKKFADAMHKMGFKTHEYEPCVFIKKDIVAALWVDDVFVLYKNVAEFQEMRENFMKTFEMRDLGYPKTILGINIERTEEKLTLDNADYIKFLLEEFKMQNCNPIATPMEFGITFNQDAEPCKGPYSCLIGSLMYLAVTTRPDIAYATTFLSQFNQKPTTEHWNAAKRVLKYLAGTINLKMCFQKNGRPLVAFSDSNFGNKIDGKSFGGYIFMLGGGPISWSCKKHRIVTLSSAESEYIQLTATAKEAIFLKRVLDLLISNSDEPICIFTDSQAALKMSENPIVSDASKHINQKQHFIRYAVDSKLVRLVHISTSSMPADFLTKSLPKDKHVFCTQAVGLKI